MKRSKQAIAATVFAACAASAACAPGRGATAPRSTPSPSRGAAAPSALDGYDGPVVQVPQVLLQTVPQLFSENGQIVGVRDAAGCRLWRLSPMMYLGRATRGCERLVPKFDAIEEAPGPCAGCGSVMASARDPSGKRLAIARANPSTLEIWDLATKRVEARTSLEEPPKAGRLAWNEVGVNGVYAGRDDDSGRGGLYLWKPGTRPGFTAYYDPGTPNFVDAVFAPRGDYAIVMTAQVQRLTGGAVTYVPLDGSARSDVTLFAHPRDELPGVSENDASEWSMTSDGPQWLTVTTRTAYSGDVTGRSYSSVLAGRARIEITRGEMVDLPTQGDGEESSPASSLVRTLAPEVSLATAVDADGHVLAVASGAALRVVSLPSLDVKATLDVKALGPLALSNDGSLVATGVAGDAVEIYPVKSGAARLTRIAVKADRLIFRDDGAILFAIRQGNVKAYDVRSGVARDDAARDVRGGTIDPLGRVVGLSARTFRRLTDGAILSLDEAGNAETDRGIWDGAAPEERVFRLGDDPLASRFVTTSELGELLHHPHLARAFFNGEPLGDPRIARRLTREK